VNVDEELGVLEDLLRRLKVEYDVFFGGGSKRPPVDLEWRLQGLLKKNGDTQKLNHSQRFRYNAVAQRYAVFGDLWRQKLRIKEEGYRRPQDALLAIQGLRTEDEHAAARALKQGELDEPLRPAEPLASANPPLAFEAFEIATSDPIAEKDKVLKLFETLIAARRRAGDRTGGTFESFLSFLSQKTAQIRRDSACEAVEFRVEMDENKVRLKARPRK
jgi:hypothetical protein